MQTLRFFVVVPVGQMLQVPAFLKSALGFGQGMIISRTPVRVSFCGGGTDIDDFSKSDASGGLVISTTISKYIHVTVNRLSLIHI